MNSTPPPFLWKALLQLRVKMTDGIHVPAKPYMEVTSGIGFHFQLEMSWTCFSRGRKHTVGIPPSPNLPPPSWKTLLELEMKMTAAIHVPAKPYERHFWNWISFPTGNVLDMLFTRGKAQNSSGIAHYSRNSTFQQLTAPFMEDTSGIGDENDSCNSCPRKAL